MGKSSIELIGFIIMNVTVGGGGEAYYFLYVNAYFLRILQEMFKK